MTGFQFARIRDLATTLTHMPTAATSVHVPGSACHASTDDQQRLRQSVGSCPWVGVARVCDVLAFLATIVETSTANGRDRGRALSRVQHITDTASCENEYVDYATCGNLGPSAYPLLRCSRGGTVPMNAQFRDAIDGDQRSVCAQLGRVRNERW